LRLPQPFREQWESTGSRSTKPVRRHPARRRATTGSLTSVLPRTDRPADRHRAMPRSQALRAARTAVAARPAAVRVVALIRTSSDGQVPTGFLAASAREAQSERAVEPAPNSPVEFEREQHRLIEQ